MSITVTKKTITMQVEAISDDIKLLGTVNANENRELLEVNGSIYRVSDEEERYLGSFTLMTSLSINLDDKREIGVMPDIASKINSFVGEIMAEIEKEGNIN